MACKHEARAILYLYMHTNFLEINRWMIQAEIRSQADTARSEPDPVRCIQSISLSGMTERRRSGNVRTCRAEGWEVGACGPTSRPHLVLPHSLLRRHHTGGGGVVQPRGSYSPRNAHPYVGQPIFSLFLTTGFSIFFRVPFLSVFLVFSTFPFSLIYF